MHTHIYVHMHAISNASASLPCLGQCLQKNELAWCRSYILVYTKYGHGYTMGDIIEAWFLCCQKQEVNYIEQCVICIYIT